MLVVQAYENGTHVVWSPRPALELELTISRSNPIVTKKFNSKAIQVRVCMSECVYASVPVVANRSHSEARTQLSQQPLLKGSSAFETGTLTDCTTHTVCRAQATPTPLILPRPPSPSICRQTVRLLRSLQCFRSLFYFFCHWDNFAHYH